MFDKQTLNKKINCQKYSIVLKLFKLQINWSLYIYPSQCIMLNAQCSICLVWFTKPLPVGLLGPSCWPWPRWTPPCCPTGCSCTTSTNNFFQCRTLSIFSSDIGDSVNWKNGSGYGSFREWGLVFCTLNMWEPFLVIYFNILYSFTPPPQIEGWMPKTKVYLYNFNMWSVYFLNLCIYDASELQNLSVHIIVHTSDTLGFMLMCLASSETGFFQPGSGNSL